MSARDEEIRRIAAELDVLMDSLTSNVAELEAMLADPAPPEADGKVAAG